MYFSAFCESVETPSSAKSYNFVTILLQTYFGSRGIIYICFSLLHNYNSFLNNFSTSTSVGVFFFCTYTPSYRFICYWFGGGVFLPWGYCWVLVWECVGKIMLSSIDLTPPTHNTHKHIHIFGASLSVTLGVVTSWSSVCVLLQRAFTSDKPACSICLRLFDIEFWGSKSPSIPNVVFTQYGFAVNAPPNTSSNVILVLSYAIATTLALPALRSRH